MSAVLFTLQFMAVIGILIVWSAVAFAVVYGIIAAIGMVQR